MASGRDSTSNSDIPRGLVNRTGTPLGRGSRLPSVRGQRDLTLGGIQRKVFTPNVNVKKKTSGSNETPKADAAGSLASISQGREGGGRGRVKAERGRGRGRGRGADNTIQLHSEFAHGPMGGSTSGWSRGSVGGGGGREGGEGRTGESSAVIKASIRQRGNQEDKALLDTLLRDDFISDISAGEARMAPIRLPLNLNNAGVKAEVKSEIKEEIMESDDIKGGTLAFPSAAFSSSCPTKIQDILFNKSKSEKGELLVFQFPDTLPGLPASVLSESRPGTSTNSATGEEELSERVEACQLQDCLEGYMGQLRLRKSGKVELVLGENVMEILPGLPINFHQELVSVHTDDSSGQMVALGPVDHKLVVTPDYNHLISQISSFR